MKTCAILQPFYIPWKGVFDLIRIADEFVLYDTVRYVEHSWINRNKIKANNGLQWLQIPVMTKGKYDQTIKDAKIAGYKWLKTHPQSIRGSYAKSPYFKEYWDMFESLYCELADEKYIANVNRRFIEMICGLLGITTRISYSSELEFGDGKTERLVEICQKLGCNRYISGPAAKDYIIEEVFENVGVELQYMDYSGYPKYPQRFGEFEHGVTVLDLLFNTGKDAPYYIWGWRQRELT
ncbi:MAG: WbqC family protein [Clostridiales bacterium]|jgi:hypothetical protein|nr:WbqC family protein [Clostridiales bacterium]